MKSSERIYVPLEDLPDLSDLRAKHAAGRGAILRDFAPPKNPLSGRKSAKNLVRLVKAAQKGEGSLRKEFDAIFPAPSSEKKPPAAMPKK